MRRSFKYMITISSVIIITCLASIWTSYSFLETTYFEYTSPKLDNEVKAVILSDLHDHEFGSNNEKLIYKVKSEEPDIIFVLGDMLNSDSDTANVAVEVTKRLSKIAPVYYALGNHEIDFMEKHKDLIEELEYTGGTVLDLESQDIKVNGQKIRLGAMYDYAFALDGDNTTKRKNMKPEVYKFLTEYQDTEHFKLMLSHKPDSFIFGEAPSTWNIDLVVSGHDHGGQVILPFIGGVFGGDQGWFPEYVYGLHSLENYDILITRGLGSNPKILPRMNNRPEVMVLTLKPEE